MSVHPVASHTRTPEETAIIAVRAHHHCHRQLGPRRRPDLLARRRRYHDLGKTGPGTTQFLAPAINLPGKNGGSARHSATIAQPRPAPASVHRSKPDTAQGR
jgi:hypothetical protein